MSIRKVFLAAAAVLAFNGAADAQSITGKWTAEYPARMRRGAGQDAADELAQAILVIGEIKGDSLFGTWHPQNTPNPVEPRRIAGVWRDGKLTFVGAPTQAMIRRGGEGEQTVTMRAYFEGALKDNILEGTFYSQSEDQTITSPTAKWTAKRAAD